MKSFFLSLFLIFSVGLSIPVVEQPDQISKIVRDLENYTALGMISTGQEVLPKIKTLSNPLVGFEDLVLAGINVAEISFSLSTSNSFTSNFNSSGASLVYNLARS